MTTLGPRFQDLNLHIKLRKCKVYSANADLAAQVAHRLGFGPEAVASEGLVVAGTPIGTDDFIATHSHGRVEASKSTISDLLQLSLSCQEKFVLLQQCLQHQNSHLVRNSAWHLIQQPLQNMTRAVVSAFSIAGIGDLEFRPAHLQQLLLPFKLGGMGLVSFDECRADAAFLSAASLAQAALKDAPARLQPFHEDRSADLWTLFEKVINAFPTACANPQRPKSDIVLHTLPGLQQQVQQVTAKRSWETQLAHFQNLATTCTLRPDKERALMDCSRLRSYACREATAGFRQIPTYHRLQIDNCEWQVSVRAQLGLCMLPTYDTVDGYVRCFCNRVTASATCHHAQSCSTVSTVINNRHQAFVQVWRDILSLAGLPSTREPHCLDMLLDTQDAVSTPYQLPNDPSPAPTATAPQDEPIHDATPAPCGHATANATPARSSPPPRAPNTSQRGDISTMAPGGQPYSFDCGITSPYRAGLLPKAADTTGHAAKVYEDQKRAKYQRVGASYYKHVPLIHESSGRMGKEAWETLNWVAASATGWTTTKSQFVSTALGLLGIANMRATYRLVRAYTPVHVRLCGSALVPGVRVPTDDVTAIGTT